MKHQGGGPVLGGHWDLVSVSGPRVARSSEFSRQVIARDYNGNLGIVT